MNWAVLTGNGNKENTREWTTKMKKKAQRHSLRPIPINKHHF
jgi:hypothetical protein